MTVLVALPRVCRAFWQNWLAQPHDPHNKVNDQTRAEVSADVQPSQFAEAAEMLRDRYTDRESSERSVQAVSAFTFGGVVALFVAVCAGMLAVAMFCSWMPLLFVPSLFFSGYAVCCFMAGVNPSDDHVYPRRIEDEYIEVLTEVKSGQGDQKVYQERASRSIRQRYRLWLNRVWLRRGIKGMQIATMAIVAEMVGFAVLAPFI